jgi:amino acid adenylation domain-containing protein
MVGLVLDRSLAMIVGWLGVLKAGAAYVPLDESWPEERLALVFRTIKSLVVVTQRKFMGRLPVSAPVPVCLDFGDTAQEPTTNPKAGAKAEDPAYVIFTSGSTGQPKGVTVPHRAVNRLVLNTDYVQLGPEDCVAQASNAAFDAATFEVWGALLNGARLFIMTRDALLAPGDFSTQLELHGVTTLFVTTAVFNHLASIAPDSFRRLKHVLFGGELVDPAWVGAVLKHGPPTRLLHVYGPTEATTFATWHWVDKLPEGAATVPIGRPIANTQVYLLDPQLNPVPVGVVGEICLGGPGLARGYLNQPDLTAAQFVPHPFSAQPGERIYKTGDLARFLPDGNLQFLGRLDHQVKIRGFRIELGEVEASLEKHPQVTSAVVTLREDAPGQKRLVAYCVPKQKSPPKTDELRGFLRGKLPDYMVPSAFVLLEEMPMTAGGKVDRSRLPAPSLDRPALETVALPPRDILEVQLKQIWEKVLGLKPVGVRDNFFDLGGHSLLAVRLFSQIEKVVGKHLPLATLFQAPTIEQLACVLRQEGWTPPWSSLVAIQPGGSRPPLFIIHGVGGNVLNFHGLARHLGEDQPVYGLQSKGLDGREVPPTRIEDMAAHYLKEIQSVQPEGPYYLGGMSFGGVVAFEMAQQLHAQGQKIGLLALLDSFPLGYSELRPLTERARREADFFARRFKLHWTNLWTLPPREKLIYVRKKVRTITRRIKSRVRHAAHHVYARFGHELPDALYNVKQANFLAARDYVTKVYPGQVTLFLAREQSVTLSSELHLLWSKVAAGGVKEIEIPGNHMTLIEEPHVGVLAKRLRECMDNS